MEQIFQVFRLLVVVIGGVCFPIFLGLSVFFLFGGDWALVASSACLTLLSGAMAKHAFSTYRKVRDRQ